MARGNARARAALKKPASQYTPYALHGWDEKELRREYTRLRDIAVKRLKRIQKDPSVRDEPDISYWARKVPKLSEMVDRLEIEDALAELAIFVANPEISTVGGIKERREKQKKGFRAATGGTVSAGPATLRDWFGYLQSQGLLSIYPSGEVVEYYYNVGGDRSRLNADAFRRWLDNRDYWAGRTAEGPDPDSGSDTFDHL